MAEESSRPEEVVMSKRRTWMLGIGCLVVVVGVGSQPLCSTQAPTLSATERSVRPSPKTPLLSPPEYSTESSCIP